MGREESETDLGDRLSTNKGETERVAPVTVRSKQAHGVLTKIIHLRVVVRIRTDSLPISRGLFVGWAKALLWQVLFLHFGTTGVANPSAKRKRHPRSNYLGKIYSTQGV